MNLNRSLQLLEEVNNFKLKLKICYSRITSGQIIFQAIRGKIILVILLTTITKDKNLCLDKVNIMLFF